MAISTSGSGVTCIFGFVNVIPTGLIGAVNGVILALNGSTIQFRQVVGPAGGIISVNTVNGQFATLCGNLILEQGQVILNVTSVIPGTSTGTSALSQNLLALLLGQSGGLSGLGTSGISL